MQNVEQTIISQYANSATIVQLIQSMNEYIDPSANIDAFYNLVWNVNTAQGYGLDVWGRIVGVARGLNVPANTPNPGMFAFTPGTYALTDDQFRTVILVKALANITDCTARSLNQLLTNLFAGRGRCYVRDLGNMAMVFDFEFFLQPFEYVVITQSGAVPRPAGVQSSVFQVDVPHTFGFAEGLQFQPFDQGTFYVAS
jgi:hypothetical protein